MKTFGDDLVWPCEMYHKCLDTSHPQSSLNSQEKGVLSPPSQYWSFARPSFFNNQYN